MKANQFHAIKVIATKNCCTNAQELGSRLILSQEFETNIFSKCDRAQCECTFKHFTDRRQGIERRNFKTEVSEQIFAVRKQPYGRRVVDIHNRSFDSSRQLQAKAS